MGKKKNKKDLPTIEKMGQMGFQDGYAGRKSKEVEYIGLYTNRGINKEQIRLRVISYCLGYKKGKLVFNKGLDNCKIVKGEVALNGHPIRLSEQKTNYIVEQINEAKPKSKKKRI